MTPIEALPLIARAVGGRRSGNAFACRCPLHDDSRASLSLFFGEDGALVSFCHAGCGMGDLRAWFGERRLWPDQPASAADAVRLRRDAEAYRRERWLLAQAIWGQTVPLEYSPGGDYLRRLRRIPIDPGPNVRWHWSSFAIVVKITHPITDAACGVQITKIDKYTHRRAGGISCEIRDKRRPETWIIKRRPDPERITIGEGGVVKLGTVWPQRSLLLGEGVGTVLSGMALHCAPCGWATLGSGTLGRLRRGGVPLGVSLVGLLVDRDKSGEDACAKAAADIRAQDFRREVRLLRPPDGFNDWNDLPRELAAMAAAPPEDKAHARAG